MSYPTYSKYHPISNRFFAKVTYSDAELIAAKEIVWGENIGFGAYGSVSKALWKNSPYPSRDVAVKVVRTKDVDKIRNEVRSISCGYRLYYSSR